MSANRLGPDAGSPGKVGSGRGDCTTMILSSPQPNTAMAEPHDQATNHRDPLLRRESPNRSIDDRNRQSYASREEEGRFRLVGVMPRRGW